ncbi:MAG: hypothetical protein Ct9H90mP7_3040 [Candidatus Neomarinimicrobiota bacterium]|nr:MAG: hypothetical protein Ct9H90mP7_3040 [Candidatus Neomarinimicrobiota bacterium]
MKVLLFIRRALKEISPRKNISSLKNNVQGDVLAGITVGIIALPLALAFGEISQLGPVAGVWGAIAGGIIGGLFGAVWWELAVQPHQKLLKLQLLWVSLLLELQKTLILQQRFQ